MAVGEQVAHMADHRPFLADQRVVDRMEVGSWHWHCHHSCLDLTLCSSVPEGSRSRSQSVARTVAACTVVVAVAGWSRKKGDRC